MKYITSTCAIQVGGKFTAEALPHMANFGRVSVCGAISTYNEKKEEAMAINGKCHSHPVTFSLIKIIPM